MPDELELVRARVGKLGLAPGREEEIVREIGGHLADHAAALESSGMSNDQAFNEALSSVSDWAAFRNEVLSAEMEDTLMNHRTKVLWLPVLGSLILSNLLLAGFQIFGPPPHFYWFHAAGHVGTYCEFIVPWLMTQFIVGAVAADWSRRAGGAISDQLLAALAPAIALLGLFLLILPWAIIVDRGVSHTLQLGGFVILTVTWVVVPAIPLLAGAAPFLRKSQAQS